MRGRAADPAQAERRAEAGGHRQAHQAAFARVDLRVVITAVLGVVQVFFVVGMHDGSGAPGGGGAARPTSLRRMEMKMKNTDQPS
ncbi:MAG: hypothetical protein WDN30_14530 [Pararobbsia sp.]